MQYIAIYIPVELFKILKGDAVKVLHSKCQLIWKTQQWAQDWKNSVFILIPRNGSSKECSNYRTTALISHASKAMLKSFKLDFSSTLTENFHVQTGFRKDRGTREKNAHIHCIIEKAREFQKNIYFCFMTTLNPLVVWITSYGKFLKRWKHQTTLPVY